MKPDEQKNISAARSEALRDLVRARAKVTWLLTALLLIIYLGNILLMSVLSDYASATLGAQTAVTVGIAYSVFVVIAGALTAGGYSYWADRRLDALIKRARDDLQVMQETQEGK